MRWPSFSVSTSTPSQSKRRAAGREDREAEAGEARQKKFARLEPLPEEILTAAPVLAATVGVVRRTGEEFLWRVEVGARGKEGRGSEGDDDERKRNEEGEERMVEAMEGRKEKESSRRNPTVAMLSLGSREFEMNRAYIAVDLLRCSNSMHAYDEESNPPTYPLPATNAAGAPSALQRTIALPRLPSNERTNRSFINHKN
ncbi:hypothetical protein ACLOJK_012142 [Asimina triloba]